MRSKSTALVAVKPTPTKSKLHPYSNSRLNDSCECPTYGAVHSQRTYATNARSMALDAGSAMHEVFAAVRIWQLEHVQKLPKHARATARRIFGTERWRSCNTSKATEPRDQLIDLCFAILHSGSFYDDPSDDIRTLTNMELSTIRYVDDMLPVMPSWPIWVASAKQPNGLVGIEQTFDVTLHYADKKQLRYIGTIDGLTLNRGRCVLEENKTASRLDTGWRQSFEMLHQVTGYCAASTTIFGFPVYSARIHGLKIKQGNYGDNSYTFEVQRDVHAITHWARWIRFTAETLHEPYTTDWENAPRFTHSCNRYFRPCTLLPFCADTPEGRKQAFEEMTPTEPSPSERVILDRV
jgi:hypothetical protein